MAEEFEEVVEGAEYEEDSSDLSHDEDLDAAFAKAVEKHAPEESGVEHTEAKDQADQTGAEEGQAEFDASNDQGEAKEVKKELPGDLPNSWNHDSDAQAWAKAPKEIKEVVKRRETELLALVNKKSNEFNKAREEYETATKPLQHVLTEIEPLQKKWRAEGKTTAEGILRAIATRDYIMEADPLELAKKFLKKSGKGPEALVESYSSKRDSEIEALRNELSTVKNGLTERQQQEQKLQQQQYVQNITSSIEQAYNKLASTKNAFGEDLYPQTKDRWFSEKLGSLVVQRMQKFPEQSPEQHVLATYQEMGGQVQNASSTRSTDVGRMKRAATSAYGKGSTGSGKAKFSNYDDAFSAAAEQLGLVE